MKKQRTDTPDVLRLDCKKEVDRLVSCIRDYTARELKRRGLVVAVSGGIDSSVVAALCVQAVGKKHVFGLLMPEKESSSETQRLGELVVKHLDVEMQCTDITGILEAVGCYTARDKAIRSAIPEYERSFKSKIVLPNLLDDNKYRLFSVVAQSPDGQMYKARLSLQAYLNIVAATNFKQRVRKMLEYYHADRLNYAVTGTPNRLEYDQGFFVKLATARPTSSRSHTFTRHRYTSSLNTSACQRRSLSGLPLPTRTACRRARRNSSSRCRITCSTTASTARTTICRPSRWRRCLAIRPSRSTASITT